MQQVDQYQAQQFELQQARQRDAQQRAAQNAQTAAIAAYRKTLADVYGMPSGPQPPMPGQASVPMMSPAPPAGPGTAPAPALPPGGPGVGGALPPYRSFQRGQGGTPTPAPSTSFELPARPPRLDMAAVMRNAPQDPVAFEAYMEKMTPYLSAQAKGEADQLRTDLQRERLQNQYMIAQQASEDRRLSIEERREAAKEMARLREMMLGIQKEKAETQKTAKGGKVSEKMRQSEEARTQALRLVQELRTMALQHPEVVGVRGSIERPLEAVSGAFGGGSSVAHDFQQKTRMLQNIVKKYEPYGPEGRVLKGELADRDQIVPGLGAWTSAANAVSGLDNLEGFLTKNAPEKGAPAGGAAPSGPKPGAIETGEGGAKYRFKGGDPSSPASWERV